MNFRGGAKLEDFAVAKSDGHFVRARRLQAISRYKAAGNSLGPAKAEYSGLLNARAPQSELPSSAEVAHALIAAVITANHFNRQTGYGQV